MEEIFKEIPGYPGYYVSDWGNVLSKRGGREMIMKQSVRGGQKVVGMYRSGSNKASFVYVARLVLLTFRGLPAAKNLLFAHNIDGDVMNNKLENLEWVIAKTTDEYDPEKSLRKGVLRPDFTKTRMTEAKLHQSEESIRKGAETRRKTCALRNEQRREAERKAELISE